MRRCTEAGKRNPTVHAIVLQNVSGFLAEMYEALRNGSG